MGKKISISKIVPTVFLKQNGDKLQQLIRLTVSNLGNNTHTVVITNSGDIINEFDLGMTPKGESDHEIYLDELTVSTNIEFVLKNEDVVADVNKTLLKPVKHWTVHVVQLSHQDPGYTDLPSRVLEDHNRWLGTAIELAKGTESFPDDAKFRIVVEQTWSIDHFLKHASEDKASRMIDQIRSGRFEVTALFGNMTTELCGHEVLARTLYHTGRLKRKYGIPIVSAEHNDITGISWGLSRVLTDAGIKIFCPGIPLYYNWDNGGLRSFWDEKAIFPHGGPGAFWWEAPTGKKVLFWCNNSGCGGDWHTGMPGLAGRLQELDDTGYPYSVMRWPVTGGARDNSPYIYGYAHTIKKWNEKWAYPRLICSTNAMFYNDFIRQVPDDLPVFRGELAGQDYPAGSTSTARLTAVNRNNHINLPTAEKLASAASLMTDYNYPWELLFKTYEEVLWHDEHAWGYHFPCGPAAEASEYEKAITAVHASAYAHEIINKSMARIADNIKLENEGFHLVVFNSAPMQKTGYVRALLRELDNCGSEMVTVPPEEDPAGERYLRGILLTDRWHANPPLELVDGKFDLVDLSTSENVPFQIIELESADETVPYAAQRLGLGSGSRRYGFFEYPLGLKRDLTFIAANVPAYGYKTYRLVPVESAPQFESRFKVAGTYMENEFYRVSVDRETGAISSIYDKSAGCELVDRDCTHGFNTLVVRTPKGDREYVMDCVTVKEKLAGPVCASIEITGSVFGHPAVKQTVSLYKGIKQIFLDTRILKDSTPLLDAHLAFPFNLSNPRFRYEGSLSVMNPIADYLPGSYSDTIAVQNWVKVSDDRFNILWSSIDAPMAGFGGLWPGYVSPAHRCLIGEWAKHPPLQTEDLKKGWIYSNIFCNNFGTNFSVSQVGDVLFRYVITSSEGNVSDCDAAVIGWQSVMPFEQIFTKRPRKGTLPISGSFAQTDNDKVIMLNFKMAENNNGFIMRLWNMSKDKEDVQINFAYLTVNRALFTNLAEEETGEDIDHDERSISVTLDNNAVATIRVIGRMTNECFNRIKS